MAVADLALAEAFDISPLLSEQCAALIGHRRHSRPKDGVASLAYVPAIDRPLRRLGAVIVLQRLAAQPIARIARQILARFAVCHFASSKSDGSTMSLAPVGGFGATCGTAQPCGARCPRRGALLSFRTRRRL